MKFKLIKLFHEVHKNCIQVLKVVWETSLFPYPMIDLWIQQVLIELLLYLKERIQVSCIAGGFFTNWATMEAWKTEVGNLFLLQGIFPPQNLSQSLLHCKQILYQLSYQGSPKKPNSAFYCNLDLLFIFALKNIKTQCIGWKSKILQCSKCLLLCK